MIKRLLDWLTVIMSQRYYIEYTAINDSDDRLSAEWSGTLPFRITSMEHITIVKNIIKKDLLKRHDTKCEKIQLWAVLEIGNEKMSKIERMSLNAWMLREKKRLANEN